MRIYAGYKLGRYRANLTTYKYSQLSTTAFQKI